jgi:nucleotide-binding universal stress UspA family protein
MINTEITQIKEEAEKKLSEFLQKLTKYKKSRALIDIPISSHLIQGLPDEITLYIVESEKANLIIMGIAGKDVRTFEPMGKIASKIVERNKIPVAIIPEDTEFNGIDKIKNVLYTTAFDESDFSAIQKLISFVTRLDVTIFCLHIGNKETTPWDKVKMDGLHEYFYKVYGKANVECDLIVSVNILNALDEFISQKHIDLISITTHKRKLISKLINPDITLKILYHTRIPLLILPG